MLDILFKLTEKLRSNKGFKSLTTCIYFLTESLLGEDQHAYQSDVVTIIKHEFELRAKAKSGTVNNPKATAEVVAINSN